MKLNTALAKSLLMAASLGAVGPLFAQSTGTVPASSAEKSATKAAPGKAAPGGKPQPAPAPKEETPAEIVLPGVVKPRPSGGFLSVQVVDGKLQISFYDAKKRQVPADVPRAAARWRSNRKVSEERSVLNPSSDGKTLTSIGFVRPPFVFKVYLTLLSEEGTAVESHVIDLNPTVRSDGADADEGTE